MQRRSGVSLIEYVLVLTFVAGLAVFATLCAQQLSASYESVASAVSGFQAIASTDQRLTNGLPENSIGRSIPFAGQVERLLPFAFGALLVCMGWLLYQRRKLEQQCSVLARQQGSSQPSNQTVQILDKRSQIQRLLQSVQWHDLSYGELSVANLMSRDLHCVDADVSAGEVLEKMSSSGLRHMVVVNKEERLVGIISDRDLAKPDVKSAAEMMTPDPLILKPQTKISVAITMLLKNRISCLPVVNNGSLCGLITISDLIMTLQCLLKALADNLPQPNDSPDVDTTFDQAPELQAQPPCRGAGGDAVTPSKKPAGRASDNIESFSTVTR